MDLQATIGLIRPMLSTGASTLEELFDVVLVEESGQAIDLLLQGQHSGVVYEQGKAPSSERSRDLQLRVDNVDDFDPRVLPPIGIQHGLHGQSLDLDRFRGWACLVGWAHTMTSRPVHSVCCPSVTLRTWLYVL